MASGGVPGVAGGTLAAGPRFGVRSMSAPLRRVLLRRPSLTGDFAAADWRPPDVGRLARQHEAFGQLLTDLGCEPEIAPGIFSSAIEKHPLSLPFAADSSALHAIALPFMSEPTWIAA